jgi:phosphoribosylaminoimidazolecarboxamide formyltransferase/IMP cyclohydrolase
VAEAYAAALAGDPTSAFGGILVCNKPITREAAKLIHELFCEVIIAPGYEPEALELLAQKANRIILRRKDAVLPVQQVRTLLNGFIAQDKDVKTETAQDLRMVTKLTATSEQIEDLIFANKLVKHTKSNTIVLVRNGQLCASGTGQTSRVDALRQAIAKAHAFNFDLHGAVMASDAFFPFPDCVEIAHEAGINAVVQPGGSIKDQLSVDFCDAHHMAMYMTGTRHFRH